MARASQDKIDPAVLKSALVLVIGALAVVFDTTIVSVALHPLAVRLHTSLSVIQWVTTRPGRRRRPHAPRPRHADHAGGGR